MFLYKLAERNLLLGGSKVCPSHTEFWLNHDKSREFFPFPTIHLQQWANRDDTCFTLVCIVYSKKPFLCSYRHGRTLTATVPFPATEGDCCPQPFVYTLPSLRNAAILKAPRIAAICSHSLFHRTGITVAANYMQNNSANTYMEKNEKWITVDEKHEISVIRDIHHLLLVRKSLERIVENCRTKHMTVAVCSQASLKSVE